MRQHISVRKGNVAVFTAVCLAVLVGAAAFALDGGLLLHNRRAAQAAADAATLAASDSLFLYYQTYSGLDGNGAATAAALATAAANGFNNDGTTNQVTVNIPPASGLHMGQAGYAEVIITYNQSRGFSAIWSSNTITVTARAVGVGKWVPFRDGILVLDPSGPGSLTNGGGGQIQVVNADVIVDSNAPNAAVASGGGTLTAPNFYITGVPGTSTSGGGTFTGTIWDNQVPTPDPLAYIPPPDPTTLTVQSNHQTTISSNQTVYLQPGVYTGGIHVAGQANIVLAPGIYYMDGGGFSFTGQGSFTGNGVMIYTDPKQTSDVVNINGLGQINWTPMTSGPYTGIALWQRRDSTNTVSLTGNGTSAIYGTFYAQHGLLSTTGNGGQDVLGSQYISYDVKLGGNGNFSIAWQQQLSARTRILNLVE
jgi:Flp pilus assembly protein TadG